MIQGTIQGYGNTSRGDVSQISNMNKKLLQYQNLDFYARQNQSSPSLNKTTPLQLTARNNYPQNFNPSLTSQSPLIGKNSTEQNTKSNQNSKPVDHATLDFIQNKENISPVIMDTKKPTQTKTPDVEQSPNYQSNQRKVILSLQQVSHPTPLVAHTHHFGSINTGNNNNNSKDYDAIAQNKGTLNFDFNKLNNNSNYGPVLSNAYLAHIVKNPRQGQQFPHIKHKQSFPGFQKLIPSNKESFHENTQRENFVFQDKYNFVTENNFNQVEKFPQIPFNIKENLSSTYLNSHKESFKQDKNMGHSQLLQQSFTNNNNDQFSQSSNNLESSSKYGQICQSPITMSSKNLGQQSPYNNNQGKSTDRETKIRKQKLYKQSDLNNNHTFDVAPSMSNPHLLDQMEFKDRCNTESNSGDLQNILNNTAPQNSYTLAHTNMRSSNEKQKSEQFFTDVTLSLMCPNHPSKKGQYVVDEACFNQEQSKNLHKNKFYCSRCAINLVSEGLQLIENEDIIKKYQQIQDFIAILQYLTPNLQASLQLIQKKSENIDKFYDHQCEKIKDFFTRIQRYFMDECDIQLNQINTAHFRAKTLYTEKINEMKATILDCQRMKQDIVTNLHQIVQTIDIQPFSEIMKQYNDKCNIYSQNSREIRGIYINVLQLETNTEKKFGELINLIAPFQLFEYQNLQTTLVQQTGKRLSSVIFQSSKQECSQDEKSGQEESSSKTNSSQNLNSSLNQINTSDLRNSRFHNISSQKKRLASHSPNLVSKFQFVDENQLDQNQTSEKKGSLYISFENQEIFDIAIQTELESNYLQGNNSFNRTTAGGDTLEGLGKIASVLQPDTMAMSENLQTNNQAAAVASSSSSTENQDVKERMSSSHSGQQLITKNSMPSAFQSLTNLLNNNHNKLDFQNSTSFILNNKNQYLVDYNEEKRKINISLNNPLVTSFLKNQSQQKRFISENDELLNQQSDSSISRCKFTINSADSDFQIHQELEEKLQNDDKTTKQETIQQREIQESQKVHYDTLKTPFQSDRPDQILLQQKSFTKREDQSPIRNSSLSVQNTSNQSQSSKQYMNILDKITINQLKTNQYYNDVMQRCSFTQSDQEINQSQAQQQFTKDREEYQSLGLDNPLESQNPEIQVEFDQFCNDILLNETSIASGVSPNQESSVNFKVTGGFSKIEDEFNISKKSNPNEQEQMEYSPTFHN